MNNPLHHHRHTAKNWFQESRFLYSAEVPGGAEVEAEAPTLEDKSEAAKPLEASHFEAKKAELHKQIDKLQLDADENESPAEKALKEKLKKESGEKLDAIKKDYDTNNEKSGAALEAVNKKVHTDIEAVINDIKGKIENAEVQVEKEAFNNEANEMLQSVPDEPLSKWDFEEMKDNFLFQTNTLRLKNTDELTEQQVQEKGNNLKTKYGYQAAALIQSLEGSYNELTKGGTKNLKEGQVLVRLGIKKFQEKLNSSETEITLGKQRKTKREMIAENETELLAIMREQLGIAETSEKSSKALMRMALRLGNEQMRLMISGKYDHLKEERKIVVGIDNEQKPGLLDAYKKELVQVEKPKPKTSNEPPIDHDYHANIRGSIKWAEGAKSAPVNLGKAMYVAQEEIGLNVEKLADGMQKMLGVKGIENQPAFAKAIGKLDLTKEQITAANDGKDLALTDQQKEAFVSNLELELKGGNKEAELNPTAKTLIEAVRKSLNTKEEGPKNMLEKAFSAFQLLMIAKAALESGDMQTLKDFANDFEETKDAVKVYARFEKANQYYTETIKNTDDVSKLLATANDVRGNVANELFPQQDKYRGVLKGGIKDHMAKALGLSEAKIQVVEGKNLIQGKKNGYTLNVWDMNGRFQIDNATDSSKVSTIGSTEKTSLSEVAATINSVTVGKPAAPAAPSETKTES